MYDGVEWGGVVEMTVGVTYHWAVNHENEEERRGGGEEKESIRKERSKHS